uniref:Uncharacterized protein n=1 Tax=Haptolina brevifila TaxID=156173 RepID=A0A7S2FZP8_9EUKA|mmetsp:Transcript_23378/g.46697  ORF Transcript_23378/g.46697 Transcript_23378/m.46697 type:complete len:201 (+) Transcript_23378:423-1025(+)
MGNNVMAGALMANRCSFGEGSKWISLSAPWRGSLAADFIINICRDPSIWNEPIRWIAKEMNYCNGSSIQPAYLSLRSDNPILASGTMAKFVTRHADAALCGSSPFGITSRYSVALEALSLAVGYPGQNDAMVGLEHCILPAPVGGYLPTFMSTWYVGALNHADGTMRDGNGGSGDAERQPGEWLQRQTSSRTFSNGFSNR